MFESIKKVHIVGIGGIGISAIAKLLLHKGIAVSGSDMHPSNITEQLEKKNAQIFSGHFANQVPQEANLVIYSTAVPEDNVERQAAVEYGIPQKSYPEMLGDITKEYSTIVVTGTNGKSTTTAMLGLILEAAGYDPTVIVGTQVPGFDDGNLRVGNGRFLVVEGCEYQANMLHLNPEMIVLTNIEEDHLDFYRDIDHIRESFQTFVDKCKGKGLVVWNLDDKESNKLVIDKGIRFGSSKEAEYFYLHRSVEGGSQTVDVLQNDPDEISLGAFALQVPGEFNIQNALAATAAAMELGIPFETIQHTLKKFSGTWRRFERLGKWHGADLISDYGHHPTAIEGTIKAVKEFFPNQRLVLCFQPHQHARTKTLFDEFVKSLADADVVILPEIYEVAGRTENDRVSSKDIVEAMDRKDVYYAEDFDVAESKLRDIVKEGDVVVIQGAGDIDTLARRIAK